jgi:hypothetical protein
MSDPVGPEAMPILSQEAWPGNGSIDFIQRVFVGPQGHDIVYTWLFLNVLNVRKTL